MVDPNPKPKKMPRLRGSVSQARPAEIVPDDDYSQFYIQAAKDLAKSQHAARGRGGIVSKPMVQSERSSFPAAYVEQAMRELHAERAKTAAATEELVQSLKKDQEVRRRERMAMAANDPMPRGVK